MHIIYINLAYDGEEFITGCLQPCFSCSNKYIRNTVNSEIAICHSIRNNDSIFCDFQVSLVQYANTFRMYVHILAKSIQLHYS